MIRSTPSTAEIARKVPVFWRAARSARPAETNGRSTCSRLSFVRAIRRPSGAHMAKVASWPSPPEIDMVSKNPVRMESWNTPSRAPDAPTMLRE